MGETVPVPVCSTEELMTVMQPLDYQTPVRDSGARSAALFVLPAAATAVTLFAAGHSILEEPFGLFDWTDAVIQVGGAAIAVGLWVAWVWVARRRRVRLVVVLPVLAWAGVHLWFAVWLGIGFFSEPWNW